MGPLERFILRHNIEETLKELFSDLFVFSAFMIITILGESENNRFMIAGVNLQILYYIFFQGA